MTTAQIARDAQYFVKTQHISRRGWPMSQDAVIERMDRVERDGAYDKTQDGLRRSREGAVGEARMMVQVATSDNDTLLIFWSLENGHQRRILVDSESKIWMDANGRAVVLKDSNNKYFAPCQAIIWARAH